MTEVVFFQKQLKLVRPIGILHYLVTKKKDRIYSDLQEQTRHSKDCQVSETISTTTATITETIL